MDDLLQRIEELLAKEPLAAAELADEVLERVRDEALLVTARVLGVWGGVRRVLGDWPSAEAAYVLAKHQLLIAGAGPAEWIGWHGRMAFLHRDKRELDDARKHASAAVELARELGDSTLLAHAEVDLALILRYLDAEQARQLVAEALDRLATHLRPSASS